MQRCSWCNLKNPKYVDYHDNEWGVPEYDEKKLFELLILENFQAGLSWECVLNKRDYFIKSFDDFDIDKIIDYKQDKIDCLMQNKKIIRNRRKIEAAIQNAKVFKDISSEFGSFSKYIWSFTDKKTIYEIGKTRNELSDLVSNDLKKRGMKFVGTVIVYSFLQAIGVINSHEKGCFKYIEK